MTFLENVLKDYERDIEDLNKAYEIIKKLNNANVKLMLENSIIEKALYLTNLTNGIKTAIEVKGK